MGGHVWHVIVAVIAAVAVTDFGLGWAKAADVPAAPPAPPSPPSLSYGGPPAADFCAYPPHRATGRQQSRSCRRSIKALFIGRGQADTERTGLMGGEATLFMGVAGGITAGDSD
jgi:hypothetical protein